jgi:hypothetical protein
MNKAKDPAGQETDAIDEFITFEDGVMIKVPRHGSPKGTARGDVDVIKPVLIDPRDYLEGMQVGAEEVPPPIVIAAVDDSFHVEVTNINGPQAFWHRSMTHGELHFAHTGRRTVETESGTVTQEPGQFIYFPRGLAHHNIGEPGVFALVLYVRSDMVVFPKPVRGRKPWTLKEVLKLREEEETKKGKTSAWSDV